MGASHRPRGRHLVAGLFGLAIALAIATTASGSHFRYGNYTWESTGATSVDFTLANGFRRNGYTTCYDTTTGATEACSGVDSYPLPGDVFQENVGATVFDPGDGNVIGSPGGALRYLVTSVDVANNWLFALALDPDNLPATDTTISHTYALAGDRVAFTSSCCRIGDSINATGNYRVETIVNVGGTNRPPVSALPPIVNCPTSGLCQFQVPATDADNDALAFRLSTSTESGIPNQPGPPHATNAASISPSGLYTWDTTGATVSAFGTTYYSTQVTIDDLTTAGGVKSKISVDFLIRLANTVGAAPTFVSPPTPACGSTVTGTVGTAMTFTVSAADTDAGDSVTLTAAGLPIGSTMTPSLPASGNPVSSVFSWTPAAASSSIVTFAATDNSGNQVLCSLTLDVTQQQAKATTTTYTGSASVQYSDAASLSGTLTETTGGAAVPGKTLSFTIGTQSATAGPTNASGSASTSLVVTQQPGSATSVVTAFAGDATHAASSSTSPFTIAREDCTLAYSGDLIVAPLAMTTLAADLGEPDASLGNLSGKTVTFTVTDASLATQTFTAVTDASGHAETTVALPAGVYGVSVAFAGDAFYLACETGMDAIVTVQAAGAKVTGGGWIAVSGRTNFGFNAIPDATGWKGQFQVRVGNSKSKFHANTVTSLTSTGPTNATWRGTGRWNRQPGYTFEVSVVDNGSSGKKGDTISIVIRSPGGAVVFTTGGAQPLKGGNITVHK